MADTTGEVSGKVADTTEEGGTGTVRHGARGVSPLSNNGGSDGLARTHSGPGVNGGRERGGRIMGTAVVVSGQSIAKWWQRGRVGGGRRHERNMRGGRWRVKGDEGI